MSPLATGVNGLAFGEVKEASLVTMLLVGIVMNILAAVVIAAWVLYVVRPVIGV